MRAMRLLLGLALLLSLATLALGAVPTRAAVSLTVSPALIELDAKPGGKGAQAVTITNGGDAPLDLAVAVEPYRSATGDQSATGWLTVEPAALTVEPGQQGSVTVTITVPKKLKSGGRYAAVSSTTKPNGGGNGAAMAGKIGVPFMIAVKGSGKLTEKATLAQFAPVMAPDGRIAFAALVRNTGNLHLRPTGEIDLTRAGGGSLGKIAFQSSVAILPGTDGLLVSESSVPLPSGASYRAEAVLEYGGNSPLKRDVTFAPKPALAVAGTSVCENLDRGPTMRVHLRNDGTLGLQPRIQVAVQNSNKASMGVASPTSPVVVWPGETSEVVIDVPKRLDSGAYTAMLRIDLSAPDSSGRTAVPPIEQPVPFQIGGLGEGAAPLCSA
ncbi:MAG TPA: hypothetical protein VFL82_13650 [Thermomicrobiales bacterium]|nr:hypothetical protein [Thermomicrobiales bacterium]